LMDVLLISNVPVIIKRINNVPSFPVRTRLVHVLVMVIQWSVEHSVTVITITNAHNILVVPMWFWINTPVNALMIVNLAQTVKAAQGNFTNLLPARKKEISTTNVKD
jgi:hypothetical protein